MTAKLTLSTTFFVMVTDKVLRLYNVMELGSKINVNYVDGSLVGQTISTGRCLVKCRTSSRVYQSAVGGLPKWVLSGVYV